MKKIIALLLALIMTFSVATIAFAADEEVAENDELAAMLGDYAWILDVPAGTIAPALKVAMFALKIAKFYIKFCNLFNLDPTTTAGKIVDFVVEKLEDAQVQQPETAPALA